RTAGGSVEAQNGQRLIVGPWEHGSHEGVFPGRNFGPGAGAAALDLTEEYASFLDRWLRGDREQEEHRARVRIFVMGIDQWRDEDDWPLPGTRYTDFYLGGDAPANSDRGGGRLDLSRSAVEAQDLYLYDPRRPVPTSGGPHLRPTLS